MDEKVAIIMINGNSSYYGEGEGKDDSYDGCHFVEEEVDATTTTTAAAAAVVVVVVATTTTTM